MNGRMPHQHLRILVRPLTAIVPALVAPAAVGATARDLEACIERDPPWYSGPGSAIVVQDSDLGILHQDLIDAASVEFEPSGSRDAGAGAVAGAVARPATPLRRETDPSGAPGGAAGSTGGSSSSAETPAAAAASRRLVAGAAQGSGQGTRSPLTSSFSGGSRWPDILIGCAALANGGAAVVAVRLGR